MKKFDRFPKHSMLFAPMEGITEEAYRVAMLKTFPEWDLFFTDFLRVPSTGRINQNNILAHYGERIYSNPEWRKKNSFQILTSHRAQTREVVEVIEDLKIEHLDLNLGCPSNTVNSHMGGAYLLTTPKETSEIIKSIRDNYSGTFTVKMRLGYKNTDNFVDNLKMIEDLGVEAITIHARTKEQLYKGMADWSYLKLAVDTVNIPIIANGDIWTVDDIEAVTNQTGCYAVMCGRSAMKTPWLAKLNQERLHGLGNFDETFLLFERKKYLEIYFEALYKEFRELGWKDESILKRFKSFSRNLFDDFHNGETLRGNFLRSESLSQFQDFLYEL
jgi:tRNA-dihydrouridine synthase B